MVYAQLSTCPRKWHIQTPMGLWHTNGWPNLGQKTKPYNHHHHHVVRPAQISLTLSLHVSLSFSASSRSSGLHPVSSHSCCMYVRVGRPAFDWPYAGSTGVHHLRARPACLVRLAWIVFVIGVRWPYSWCFVGCCCQDLFNIALNILNQQKKKICKIVDFVIPADHRKKLQECEKGDKYLDFARELKKLWNMKATIVPIVIYAFGTVTKGLLKGLEDLEVGSRVETIQLKI